MRGICVVLVLAAGCGKVLHAMPDGGGGGGGGGGGDATPGSDAAPSDPTVYLTVLTTDYSGQPDAAAIAVFEDGTGAVVRDGLVAADGTAQAALPMGGSVTVIDVTMSSMTNRLVQMTTIEGVKPGDHLTVGETKSPTSFTGTASNITATFTPYLSNASHSFTTSCGESFGTVTAGAPSTAQLSFYDACHGPTFDLLSVAEDSSITPAQYFYIYQSGLTYAANGNVTVPNMWTGMSDLAVTMTNTPANLSTIRVTHSGFMGEIMAGSTFNNAQIGTVSSATVPYAPIGTRSMTQLVLISTAEPGQQLFEDRTNSVTSSEGIDLSQLQLPWVGAASETTTGVSWPQIDGGTPDARYVRWFGTWTDGAGVVNNLAWTIEDGNAAASLTLPALPASYAMYDPSKVSGIRTGPASVVYADYANLAGYDQARPYGPNLVDPLTSLGVFVDQPVQRRISRTPLIGRQ